MGIDGHDPPAQHMSAHPKAGGQVNSERFTAGTRGREIGRRAIRSDQRDHQGADRLVECQRQRLRRLVEDRVGFGPGREQLRMGKGRHGIGQQREGHQQRRDEAGHG
ncbi:hypothetical protein D3C72_2026920 [compost metagenome]